MAGKQWRLDSGDVNTGTARHVVLAVEAADDHPLDIDNFGISFRGSNPSATPILVEIVRISGDGTLSSATPVLDREDQDDTLAMSGHKDASSEPTFGVVLWSGNFHPQGGGIDKDLPADHLLNVIGESLLAIVVTAGASVVCNAHFAGVE